MNFDLDDTIAAIASAPGSGLRGIIRLSGPEVSHGLAQLFTANRSEDLLAVKRSTAIEGRLAVGPPIGPVPGLLYYWPTAKSYTRQPSAEFHTLGAPPILDAALAALSSVGVRLAQPGEFTLRAFLGGRLDLTQAEAVLGVIDAATRSEWDVALAQLSGGLAVPLNLLRDQLIDLLAHLEAGLDFVEEDIEFISEDEILNGLQAASQALAALLEKMSSRTELAGGARIVLVGQENVGKSSLLNALAGHGNAIVSEVAGTTRDYLIHRINCHGIECQLIDTAGLTPDFSRGELHQQTQDATTEQVKTAHLRLLCLDSTRPITEWEKEQLARVQDRGMVVVTKTDQVPAESFLWDLERLLNDPAIDGLNRLPPADQQLVVSTSSLSGAGIDQLRQSIAARLGDSDAAGSQVVSGTAARCRDSLQRAHDAISTAIIMTDGGIGEELVAAEVRHVLDELATVVGAVYSDDILDRVFSRFCIGK